MKTYRVEFEIEVEAEGVRLAIEAAYEILKDPLLARRFLSVQDISTPEVVKRMGNGAIIRSRPGVVCHVPEKMLPPEMVPPHTRHMEQEAEV